MNSKGMTLVELIVTFSLLLVIVVGLYNLILEVKFQLTQKQIAKELTEYSSVMNNEIHYNLLKDQPYAIVYKQASVTNWICRARTNFGSCENNNDQGFIINKKNGSTTASQVSTTYSDLNSMCKDIFPCAVYYYGQDKTRVIALNDAISNSSDEEILQQNGIYYNNVYEPFPSPENTEIRSITIIENPETEQTQSSNQDQPSITIENIEDNKANKVLIINFPFYVKESDVNYGFKIVYPFL